MSMNHSVILNAVTQFSTPLYLYDMQKIQWIYQLLRNSLEKNIDIFYSIKANPSLGICQYLSQLGSGGEVSSRHELFTAIRAGFSPRKIIFAGPYKTDDDIALCIERNIKAIICESITEMNRVNHISEKYHVKTKILLRINPDFKVKSAPIKMSGESTQFGMMIEDVIKHQEKIKLLKNIIISGIQVYNASRILNEKDIADNINHILELSLQLSSALEMKFTCIDLGGGLGVPYFEKETALDIQLLIIRINQSVLEYQKKNGQTEFILELGRFLVSESGYFITRVYDIKKNHQKQFIITDGGMHCMMAASGLGSYIHRNFKAQHIANEASENQAEHYTVCGPLCTPSDIILKDFLIRAPAVNDLIVIEKAGAYGLSASPFRFLSHGACVEAMLFQDQLFLLRRRETIDDILQTQNDCQFIFSEGVKLC
ncbi:MAG: hypothetical protein A3I77_08275 [Gammaproteobacteria bacterium RIFCSPLOWO2_02_FULL_42_14]|nr:MAG: hypothetical protein A3B71_04110 [Gammaproteobacteria bacterium RIFCSPHIGHO2_02_FULL_42_43]OGT27585.1 MAG: hypothetical protein A2624_00415 [Gammaproteobacteria bacterium RIFCSPHIGHO2_01_FULL_42_8]OGT52900.1 MAG: hypothetical protein A3E54_07415 [Gammaproteobacteria bacterium RIFCSPHIGHO2_12_FULL_41_25]OGT61327.1 MAG: hypothetical protein A3I77_08275 [Gammaproteobacteria bacterium RIFCSPLOWO2_02_FULL_42_14]OGT87256.1 MAG: hypothetical protein A3G86_02000 [Gammaproteobacteria bacterium R